VRRSKIAALGVVASLVSTFAVIAPATPALGATTVELSGTLKTGVTFRRFLITPGPIRLNVVTIDLAKASTATAPSTVDVTVGARTTAGGQDLTSAMGIASKALVAINGDFGGLKSTRYPEHPYIQNGEVWTSGTDPAINVGLSVPAPYATTPPTGFAGRASLRISAASRFGTLAVSSWNAAQPSGGSVVGFTRRGGSIALPKPANCNLRLTGPPALASTWAKGRSGIVDTFTVAETAKCGSSTYAKPTGTDVVLSSLATGAGATALKQFVAGDTVRIRWTMGWPGVLDTLGGRPVLVEEGLSAGTGPDGIFECGGTLCENQPRTAVSMTQPCTQGIAGCKVSFVVVDGRTKKAGWSAGITLDQLVSFLRTTLGSYAAVNLDGGGSATMFVKKQGAWCQTLLPTGCLVSSLANNDGNERRVTNALVLLPGIDPQEPTPTGG
jgi:hypothetical protein